MMSSAFTFTLFLQIVRTAAAKSKPLPDGEFNVWYTKKAGGEAMIYDSTDYASFVQRVEREEVQLENGRVCISYLNTAEWQKEPGDEDEELPATQPMPGSGISDEDLRLVLETGGPAGSNKSKGTTHRNKKLHPLLASPAAAPQASISPAPVVVTVPKILVPRNTINPKCLSLVLPRTRARNRSRFQPHLMAPSRKNSPR